MMQDMVRLYMLMFLLGLVLTIIALISCLSADDDEVRALPRLGWVVVIIVLPIAGALAYLIAGRPVPEDAAGSGPGGAGGGVGGRIWRTATGSTTRQQRVLAPDDDPDFLKTLDSRARAADDELLRRFEEEFKEDDSPKRDKSIDDSPPSDG